LHIAASSLQHGVKKESWSLFEPSKFVYAFFAFNSFYSFDWEESAKQERLVRWELQWDKNTERKSESQKIGEIRKFICSTSVNDSLKNDELARAKEELALTLSKKMGQYLEEDVPSTLKSLEGIVTDDNIGQAYKERFIIKFAHLLNAQLVGKEFNDALDTILKFVFQVRNNIFHGTKTVLQMMDQEQRIRLQVYTAILLSINEMLFEAIEKRFKWSKKQIDTDLEKETMKRVAKIEAPFYNSSVVSRFKLVIPDGPLFYPCCGDDTFEPIKWFFDSVSEFHFVDSRLLPKLPKMECKVIGHKETDDRKSSSRAADNFTMPRELIEGVLASEPVEFMGQVGKIYTQEWQLAKEKKKILIHRHVKDGMAAFVLLDKMAVFFLRRESEGEGGSGQRWLQESVFELILDKLLDGGLIVTDGSGWDPGLFESADWKSFWVNKGNGPRTECSLPEDFVYYNRQFRCVGQLGRGYGPVYVWQVNYQL